MSGWSIRSMLFPKARLSSVMALSVTSGRRVTRLLRSPKFAAWLITVICLYLVVGSIFPQRDLDRVAYEAWATQNPVLSSVTEAIGLDAPFVHPLFFILLAVLTASTILCSVQRTQRALGILQNAGTIDENKAAAIRRRHTMRFDIDEQHLDAGHRKLTDALRQLGLKVYSGPIASHAVSGGWALLGSPIFHWSLVGLLVVISAGMLTRSEGLLGVVAGFERQDVEESYGLLQRGPLHGELSGFTIGVEEDVPLQYVIGGIDRGAAPMVYLRDGERELARGRVFPNQPLRYSSYMVHLSDWGLGIVTTITEEGKGDKVSQVFIDRNPVRPQEWGTATEVFFDEAGAEIARVNFSTQPGTGAAKVEVIRADGSVENQIMNVGDIVQLREDVTLRIDHLGSYVRLSMVDDWSIPILYALMVIACVAVSVSILVPYRSVWIVVDRSTSRPALCVTIHHSRGSPWFVKLARDKLSGTLREV